MPRPTRAGQDWLGNPPPTIGLPHGWRRLGYPIVFYNGCNTDYIPDESIEELLPYSVLSWGHWGAPYTTGLQPYTSEYTAVYMSICGRFLDV